MYSMDKASHSCVLVVDDEENIVKSLSFVLSRAGHTVVTAASGLEAIEQYKVHRPTIILLDVMMPEMDGYQTARCIRALDAGSETSIIFLTALGTIVDRQQGYFAGADDYVVKPFDNQMILDKVQEIKL